MVSNFVTPTGSGVLLVQIGWFLLALVALRLYWHLWFWFWVALAESRITVWMCRAKTPISGMPTILWIWLFIYRPIRTTLVLSTTHLTLGYPQIILYENGARFQCPRHVFDAGTLTLPKEYVEPKV